MFATSNAQVVQDYLVSFLYSLLTFSNHFALLRYFALLCDFALDGLRKTKIQRQPNDNPRELYNIDRLERMTAM